MKSKLNVEAKGNNARFFHETRLNTDIFKIKKIALYY